MKNKHLLESSGRPDIDFVQCSEADATELRIGGDLVPLADFLDIPRDLGTEWEIIKPGAFYRFLEGVFVAEADDDGMIDFRPMRVEWVEIAGSWDTMIVDP